MGQEPRLAVSGWEDDLNDIDLESEPHDTPEKEILWAAENGDAEKVKRLVENHPDLVNYKDNDGYTPLHRACSHNHSEVVEYLLNKGSNPSSTTELLWQPLHSCCQWNHKEVGLKLIQRGVDVNAMSEGKQTPLHIAASHGRVYDLVQLLLIQPYIKPDILNKVNETAYDIAKRGSKFYNIFEMADPAIAGIPD